MCVCAGVCVTSGDEAASWDCEMKDAVGGGGGERNLCTAGVCPLMLCPLPPILQSVYPYLSQFKTHKVKAVNPLGTAVKRHTEDKRHHQPGLEQAASGCNKVEKEKSERNKEASVNSL